MISNKQVCAEKQQLNLIVTKRSHLWYNGSVNYLDSKRKNIIN